MTHRIVDSEAELLSRDWEMGSVVQEIHTGTCCGEKEPFCDFYEQLWVMNFQMGWVRAGSEYFDPKDDRPRLPVRVLYRPYQEAARV